MCIKGENMKERFIVMPQTNKMQERMERERKWNSYKICPVLTLQVQKGKRKYK